MRWQTITIFELPLSSIASADAPPSANGTGTPTIKKARSSPAAKDPILIILPAPIFQNLRRTN